MSHAHAAPARSLRTSYMVIPARLASTRLPRKLLLRGDGQAADPAHLRGGLAGQEARRACAWRPITTEIADAVRAFGGEVQMTSPDCASGTDRVAEVARQLDRRRHLVNVQGDEPELPGERSIGRSSCWKPTPTR